MNRLPRNSILIGDATEKLRTLPDSSIDCVITSPPYYMLRNYFVENQMGMEPNVDGWVDSLRGVCREVARVLKPTGGLWLNLGDSFSRHQRYGAPAKGLLCAPERLLLALNGDGWLTRNKVIWAKPNPMPNSVTDRLNLTYEVVYFLVRAPWYYFDLDAVREPHRSKGSKRARPMIGKAPDWAGPLAGSQDGLRRARANGIPGHVLGKNPGDVWTISTRGFRGPHFATFPPELIRRPLLATCPETICTACGCAWRRKISVGRVGELVACGCGAPTVPGVVLDPFFGSGTVGAVAEQLGRDWIGIELNSDYAELAKKRIEEAREQREGVMTTTNERRAA